MFDSTELGGEFSHVRKVLEFWTIDLARAADGSFQILARTTTSARGEPLILSCETAWTTVGTIDEALGIIEAKLRSSRPAIVEKDFRQTIGENYFRFDLPKPNPAKVKKLVQEFMAIHRRQQGAKSEQASPEE